jgi:hypothetical protein
MGNTISGDGNEHYFSQEEWFSLPLKFRRHWWRETDYGERPPSAQLFKAGYNRCDWAPELRKLKAAMVAAYLDKGGSSAAFIEARARYVAARRRLRAQNARNRSAPRPQI